MTKTQFLNQFVTNFLSTWAANNYADACSLNNHEMLNHPPCEDAAFLAEKAWQELASTGHTKDWELFI